MVFVIMKNERHSGMRKKIYHKYGATRTARHGVKFDSRLEADCASVLEELKKVGAVLFYLRQVPIDLPGNIRHRVDFLVFTPTAAYFLEAKGRDLSEGKARRKIAEAVTGVEIHVVNKASQVAAVFSE